jgi:hypothetical protein
MRRVRSVPISAASGNHVTYGIHQSPRSSRWRDERRRSNTSAERLGPTLELASYPPCPKTYPAMVRGRSAGGPCIACCDAAADGLNATRAGMTIKSFAQLASAVNARRARHSPADVRHHVHARFDRGTTHPCRYRTAGRYAAGVSAVTTEQRSADRAAGRSTLSRRPALIGRLCSVLFSARDALRGQSNRRDTELRCNKEYRRPLGGEKAGFARTHRTICKDQFD